MNLVRVVLNTLVEYLDLEWVYEKETLIPPPTKNLKKMYELAMMGDMREIKDFAMQLDEQYTVFSGKLIELTAGFTSLLRMKIYNISNGVQSVALLM